MNYIANFVIVTVVSACHVPGHQPPQSRNLILGAGNQVLEFKCHDPLLADFFSGFLYCVKISNSFIKSWYLKRLAKLICWWLDMVTAIIIWFLRWTSWCKNVSVSAWAIFVKNWWRINGAEQKFKKLITQTTCVIMRHNHVLHNLVNHKKITPNFLAEGVKCVARCVTSFLLKFENSSILMDGHYAHKWDSKKTGWFFWQKWKPFWRKWCI